MCVPAVWTRTMERMRATHGRAKIAFAADRDGWLICLAVLLVTIVRSGVTYSFGMFVVQLEKAYHRPLAEQNWIGTLSFCISLSCAPLSVAFIRCLRYRGYRLGSIIGTLILTVSCLSSSFAQNPEWLFVTHSLLYGVGSSLVYMASSLVIGEYFAKDHEYHVMATSILLCGYPIGSLLFNPLNAWLMTNYGWRTAFRCSGIMILVVGLPCCWMFKSKETVGMQRLEEEVDSEEAAPPVVEEVKKRRCCTLSEVRARPEIVLWYLGNCLSYLGFYMPFVNLAYYMKLKGISTTRASWALTLLSLAECTTYIIASFLGDYLKGRLVIVNAVSAAALSVICIIWPFVDVSYPSILVISIAMGGFLGLTIVYTYAAAGEVTEQPIDVAWSFTNLWSGTGILLGPFFSGTVYDLRHSYDDVFYVVGVLYVLDTFVFSAIPIIKHYRTFKEKRNYTDMDSSEYQRQTFRITKQSLSQTSLFKEQDSVPEYGTTATTGSIQSHAAAKDSRN